MSAHLNSLFVSTDSSFPRQQVARVESAFAPPFQSSPLPTHLQPLEASTFLDEVSHQRRLAPLPESGAINPSACPNAYYGLRRVAVGAAARKDVGTNANNVGVVGVIGNADAVAESVGEAVQAPILSAVYDSFMLGGGSVEDEAVSGESQSNNSSSNVKRSNGTIRAVDEGDDDDDAIFNQSRIHWRAAIPSMVRPAAAAVQLSRLDISVSETSINPSSSFSPSSATASAANSVNAPLDDLTAAGSGANGIDAIGGSGLRIHLEDGIAKRHFEGRVSSSLRPIPKSALELQTAVALHYLTFVTPLLDHRNKTGLSTPIDDNATSSGATEEREEHEEGFTPIFPTAASVVPLAARAYSGTDYNIIRVIEEQLFNRYGLSESEADVEELNVASSAFFPQQPDIKSLFDALGSSDNLLIDSFIRRVYDRVHSYILTELMNRAEASESRQQHGEEKKHQCHAKKVKKVFVITGLEALSGSDVTCPSPSAFLSALTSLLWAFSSLMQHLSNFKAVPSSSSASKSFCYAPPSAAAQIPSPSLLDALYGEGRGTVGIPSYEIKEEWAEERGKSPSTSFSCRPSNDDWAIRFVVCLPPSLSTCVADRLSSHTSKRLRLASMSVGVPLKDLGRVVFQRMCHRQRQSPRLALHNHNNTHNSTGNGNGQKTEDFANVVNVPCNSTSIIGSVSKGSSSSKGKQAALFLQNESFGVPVSLLDAASSSPPPSSSLLTLSSKWAKACIVASAERLVSIHNNYLADLSTLGDEIGGGLAATADDEDDADAEEVEYVKGSLGDNVGENDDNDGGDDDEDGLEGSDGNGAAGAHGTATALPLGPDNDEARPPNRPRQSLAKRMRRLFAKASVPLKRKQPVVVVITPLPSSLEGSSSSCGRLTEESCHIDDHIGDFSITKTVQNMYTSIPVSMLTAAEVKRRLEEAVLEAEEELRSRVTALRSAEAGKNGATKTNMKTIAAAEVKQQGKPHKITLEELLRTIINPSQKKNKLQRGEEDEDEDSSEASGDEDDTVEDVAGESAGEAPVTFITISRDELLSLSSLFGGSGGLFGAPQQGSTLGLLYDPELLSALFSHLFTFSGDVLDVCLRPTVMMTSSSDTNNKSDACFAAEGRAYSEFMAVKAAVSIFGGSIENILPTVSSSSSTSSVHNDGEYDTNNTTFPLSAEEGGEQEEYAFPRPQMEQLYIETPTLLMSSTNDEMEDEMSTVLHDTAAAAAGSTVHCALVVRVLTPRWEVSTTSLAKAGVVTFDARFALEQSSAGSAIVDDFVGGDFGGSDVLEEENKPKKHAPFLAIARFLSDPRPLTHLESLFLATSTINTPVSQRASAQYAQDRRMLASLLLAWARRLRAPDSDVVAVVKLSASHKARTRAENDKRKMELLRQRKLQQQGRAATEQSSEDTFNKNKPSSASSSSSFSPLIDYCAPLPHEDAASTLLLISDALLDVLVQENPYGGGAAAEFSSTNIGSAGPKGWVAGAVHYLSHSGLVATVRCVQNTLKQPPAIVRAVERNERLIAAGFTKAQEALRSALLSAAKNSSGVGVGVGSPEIVAGVSGTAWAGNLAKYFASNAAALTVRRGGSSNISSKSLLPTAVLTTAAVVLTPLGRRVSSMYLPSEPIQINYTEPIVADDDHHPPATTVDPSLSSSSSFSRSRGTFGGNVHVSPIGLVQAKHLLIAHAYGLPIVSNIRNTMRCAPPSALTNVESFSFIRFLRSQGRAEARARLESVASVIRTLLFVPFTGLMLGEVLSSALPTLSVAGEDYKKKKKNNNQTKSHLFTEEEGAEKEEDIIPIAKLAQVIAAWPEHSRRKSKCETLSSRDEEDEDANGYAYIASVFCERKRHFDASIIAKALQSGANKKPVASPQAVAVIASASAADSVRLPSRGWLTEATPIVVPEAVKRSAADHDEEDDLNLTEAERTIRKEQRRAAEEAKEVIKRQLANVSVQFSKLSKRAFKKRKKEFQQKAQESGLAAAMSGGKGSEHGSAAAAAGGGAEDEDEKERAMLRIPSKMTPIGLSIEIDPSQEGADYLVPAASKGPYPSMARELCVVSTEDPLSGLLTVVGDHLSPQYSSDNRSNHHRLERSFVVPVTTSDALIVLRLALRNALVNLCLTLESPILVISEASSTTTTSSSTQRRRAVKFSSPLLEILDPVLRRPCEKVKHLVPRLAAVHEGLMMRASSTVEGRSHLFRQRIFNEKTSASMALASTLLAPPARAHGDTTAYLLSSILESSSGISSGGGGGMRFAHRQLTDLAISPSPLSSSTDSALLIARLQRISLVTQSLISTLCSSCFTLPEELTCLPRTAALSCASSAAVANPSSLSTTIGGGYADDYAAVVKKTFFGIENTATQQAAATTVSDGATTLCTFTELVRCLLSNKRRWHINGEKSTFDYLGQWLDSTVGGSSSQPQSQSSVSSSFPLPMTANTFYGYMPSLSSLCAHTAFRSNTAINDILTSRKLAEKKEVERRHQAAREAAVRFGGGGPLPVIAPSQTASGPSTQNTSSVEAAVVSVSENEKKIILGAVKMAKARGRKSFEQLFRGKPMFNFIEEGDRLHAYYISLLLLEGIE